MGVSGPSSTASGQPEAPGPKAVLGALAGKAASEVHGSGPMPGSRFEQVLVGSIALAALALCTYNVVVRYFQPALVVEWGDEVQVYLVIWAIFLALGLVCAADRHVKADLFVGMFKVPVQRRLLLLADVLGLGFSIFLVIYGSLVTWETYDYGDVSITSLRFPLWIYAAALPVGGLLMAVRYLMRLVGLLRKGP